MIFALEMLGVNLATSWQNIQGFFTANLWALWLLGAIIVALIVLIIVLIVRKRKQRGAKPEQQPTADPTVFIPVEVADNGLEDDYLTLSDQIINSKGELSRKLVEKIKNKGPQALEQLVAAYDKAQPEIQSQLQQLVKEERLLTRYSQRLAQADYPQGVLLEAWSRFNDPAALKEFVELLASPDEATQLAGVRLLSAISDPQCLTLLVAALMWPEHFISARVAEVIAAHGNNGARLLAYVLPRVDDKHKVRVLETIAQCEASFPAQTVADCLKSTNAEIRVAAARALGTGKMVEGLPHLMLSATDKAWQVRAAVAKSLGQIGDMRALKVLEVLAKDEEGWVATEAKAALDLFQQA